MPYFLDFVFPFGDQIEKQDSLFTGFRYQNSLDEHSVDFEAQQLARSGVRFQQSYSLKSVEKSPWQSKDWPWVVRQTSVYHSFDLKTGS